MIARSEVKSYWGSTPSAASLRACVGEELVLEGQRLGRDDVGRHEVADLEVDPLGREVGPEDRRHRDDEEHGGEGEATEVAPRQADGLGPPVGEHVSAPRPRGREPRTRPGPPARERRGHEAAQDTAVGPAASPRREPAHDLAHVPRRRGAGRGDRLGDERVELGGRQGLGQELGEDLDLGRLLGDEVGATTLLEGLDALAPGLDLPGQDRRELVLRVGASIALLGVVDRVLGHPEGVAAQRVTRPHRGGHLGVEPISERHR